MDLQKRSKPLMRPLNSSDLVARHVNTTPYAASPSPPANRQTPYAINTESTLSQSQESVAFDGGKAPASLYPERPQQPVRRCKFSIERTDAKPIQYQETSFSADETPAFYGAQAQGGNPSAKPFPAVQFLQDEEMPAEWPAYRTTGGKYVPVQAAVDFDDDEPEPIRFITPEPVPALMPTIPTLRVKGRNRRPWVVLIPFLLIAVLAAALYFIFPEVLPWRKAEDNHPAAASRNADDAGMTWSAVPVKSSNGTTISRFEVETPEIAAPTTATFLIETDFSATGVRLVDQNGQTLSSTGICTPSDRSLLWTFTAALDQPYSDLILADVRNAEGAWQRAEQSCHVNVQ